MRTMALFVTLAMIAGFAPITSDPVYIASPSVFYADEKAIPSKSPLPAKRVVSEANAFDYSTTISNSGERLSNEEIGDAIEEYGTFGTTSGMPTDEYIDAMSYQWSDATSYKPKSTKVEVDLSKAYTYDQLVKIQKRLSTNKGVSLYKIGNSTNGKAMYALDIDLTSCEEEKQHIVLLTGQVHARETAGSTFILKELCDIVNAYNEGDEQAIEALSSTRFVAVACVNPDGHDGIGFDEENWTYADGTLWKATANGADINRNFPGLSWMQTKNGVKQTAYLSDSADSIYYCGDYAGSCNETKAMMKFYQYFIGVKGAEMLIDYHQQGRLTYAGKSYAPEYNNSLSEELRGSCYSTQAKGSLKKHYAYDYGDTAENFGVEGTGSTNTDYAWAVAMGTKFSTQYGFSVRVDTEGNEYPLVMMPTCDEASVELLPMRSENFRSLSWEIGAGRSYLGYSERARGLIEKEYYNYNFDEMLYTYAEVANR